MGWILLCALFGLGGLALLALGLYLAAWRLSRPVLESVPAEAFPPDRFEALRPLADQLGRAGLLFAGLQRETRGRAYEAWQAVFRDPEGGTWVVAEVVGRREPRLVLHSCFLSGRVVTTSDGEFADYDVNGEWRLTERGWPDFDSQLKHHRQMVLGAGSDLRSLGELAQFQDCCRQNAERQFQHLQATGFLVESAASPGLFRVRAWKDPRVAFRMLLHSRRNKWAEANRRRDAAYQEELDSLQAERKRYGGIGEYKYLEYYKRDKERGSGLVALGWTVKGAILCVSIAVLVAVAYARGSLEPLTVGVILAVLLVHELGHVAMMVLFGYRDLHVLFLPGLGRLAPERHLRVAAWKELLVLLMGPLPGLLAGWGILASALFRPELPEVWSTIGLWAVLINFLNFLPVLPYDGGRAVNLLIFERVPALRLLYLVGSSLGVLLFGILSWVVTGTPPVLLLVILVSAFIAIPDNWRMARMAPWARHNLKPDDSETDALMKAFQIVEQTDSVKGLEKRGWTNFVDRIVRYGCSRKLGIVGTAAGLVFFFGFLLSPLGALLVVSTGEVAAIRSLEARVAERKAELEPNVSWKSVPVSDATRLTLDTLSGDLAIVEEVFRANRVETSMEDPTGGVNVKALTGIEWGAEEMAAIRGLRWDEAATWAAEEDSRRREEALQGLIGWLVYFAAREAEEGERERALADLSKAYYALAVCPARTSLGAWLVQLEMEKALMLTLYEVNRDEPIPPGYKQWFASSIRRYPVPGGTKLAWLLLNEMATRPENLKTGAFRHPGNLAGVTPAARPLPPMRQFMVDGSPQVQTEFLPRNLAGVLDWARLARGLPTREDLEAALVVAEDWAPRSSVQSVPVDRLPSDDQREMWEGRIALFNEVMQMRLQAVEAYQRERTGHPPDGPRQGLSPVTGP